MSGLATDAVYNGNWIGIAGNWQKWNGIAASGTKTYALKLQVATQQAAQDAIAKPSEQAQTASSQTKAT